MKTVKNLKAVPNPRGHRIDLTWELPENDPGITGLRILRRERTFPADENDGVVVYSKSDLVTHFSDTDLKAGTVYYYTVFTRDSTGEYHADRHARAAALATADYAGADRLYQLLPAIYHRFDTDGSLQRFLQIFGPELDWIRSFISATRDLHDLDRVESNLLPLLAQWIGWESSPELDVDARRNEVRYAPHFYRTIGMAPNLQALVKRLTNWQPKIKEFYQNVFLTNQPPAMPIWWQKRENGTWQSAQHLSLHTAFEGAPAVLTDNGGTLRLFYHAEEAGSSHIWYKSYNDAQWQPARRITHDEGIYRHPAAVRPAEGNIRLFWSALETRFKITDAVLEALRKGGVPTQLVRRLFNLKDKEISGERQFLNRIAATIGIAAAERYKKLILQHALVESGIWHLKHAVVEELETAKTLFRSTAHDMEPAAIAEAGSSDAVWLFWSSRRAGRWHIWYSRFDGDKWAAPEALTAGLVHDRQPFALVYANQIWVFWTRQTDEGWRLYYRRKLTFDFETDDWDSETEVPIAPATTFYDDREPFALVDSNDDLVLFWRSNRAGADSIWLKTYREGAWRNEEQITPGADSCQAPAAVSLDGSLLLFYRSTRAVEYHSRFYPAARTLDHRYAGSTTVDTRNLTRLQRRGKFEDDQSYVYDTAKTNDDWYARNTVGIYLTPETEEQQMILRNRDLAQALLRRFLPIHLRSVFILNPAVYREMVYTYDFPKAENQRVIGEMAYDHTIPETFPRPRDRHASDTIPEWIWLRAWSTDYQDHRTVDTTADPPRFKEFRTIHIGLLGES